jgi:hypothetical protein
MAYLDHERFPPPLQAHLSGSIKAIIPSITSSVASRRQDAADQTVLQRQIDITDRRIDQLVEELYGLTEGVRIVEVSGR